MILEGSLQTVFGWRMLTTNESNPRSLANLPMQANGAGVSVAVGPGVLIARNHLRRHNHVMPTVIAERQHDHWTAWLEDTLPLQCFASTLLKTVST